MMSAHVGARAPLRIGLAGGGSDVEPYCTRYGGHVLNATITRYAYAFIEPIAAGQISFHATDQDAQWVGHIDNLDNVPLALHLHRGVFLRIANDFGFPSDRGIRLTTFADVPAGSGLGTSSTLVVAMVQALHQYLQLPLGEYDIAHLAYEIERFDCALCGGKQDHYAATFGGFNFMEFYNDRVIINPLHIRNSTLCELEATIVLYFTGVSRQSAHIIDAQRANILREDPAALHATHAVKAQAMVMKQALLRGDLEAVCTSLRDAWTAKRNMAEQISNSNIDSIYDVAMSSGAKAGKISGAGGGGFIFFIVDPMRRHEVVTNLSKLGGEIVPCSFSQRGAESWNMFS